MAVGEFGSVIDTETVSSDVENTEFLQHVNIVHVTGTIYAVSWSLQSGNNGQLATISISNSGAITNTLIDTVTITDTFGINDLIKIADGIVAIVWRSGSSIKLSTYSISAAGAITLLDGPDTIMSRTTARIGHIAGDQYAIVGCATNSGATLATVEISSAGTIVGTTQGPTNFTSVFPARPVTFAYPVSGFGIIAFEDNNSDDGFIRSFVLNDNGTFTITTVDELEHDTSNGREHALLTVADSQITMVYVTTSDALTVKSFSLDGCGNITQDDSVAHGGSGGTRPDVFLVDNNASGIPVVMYLLEGTQNIQSRSVDGCGSIAAVDSLTTGLPINQSNPSFVQVAGTVHAMLSTNLSAETLHLTTFSVEVLRPPAIVVRKTA